MNGRSLQESVYIITGASSGIGRALAIAIARPGIVLGLIGRDQARLAETAQACAVRGASLHVLPADVRRRDELRATLLQFDAAHPVDCVIAGAGISVGTSLSGAIESEEETFDLLETNVIGALATALALIPRMRERRRGRIVLVSSIAALAPLPDAAAYSGSKAALLAYGLAMRERLRDDEVKVNVVCPGFVTTPMAEHYLGWKPFEISAEDAARRIVRGLKRDRDVIAFPWPLVVAARFQRMLPEPLRRLGASAFRFRIVPRGEQSEGDGPPERRGGQLESNKS